MEKKKISIIGITYVALLFIVYEMMLRITGFSINTAVYGLFAILVFFYSITGNLSFSEEEVNYNTVFINSFIFGIFFMFYKTLTIFTVFIVFSLFQLFIYRLIMKFKEKNKNGTPRIINERSLIKFCIDSLGIILGMIGAFMSKYGLAWEEKLESEYIFTYLGIFLIGYFYTRMNDKSWSYTNILDVLNLICLNSISTIVFLVIIYARIIDDYPVFTVLVSLILSISFQLFCRYLFRLKRFYKSKNRELIPEERVLVYGAGEAGVILAQESMTNPIFPYHIVGFR